MCEIRYTFGGQWGRCEETCLLLRFVFRFFTFGWIPLYLYKNKNKNKCYYYYSQTPPLFGHPPPPFIFIANTIAQYSTQLQWRQCFPPTILYCSTRHTILVVVVVVAISCKGQVTEALTPT